MAAALAQGETIIENAAREPEVTDLADCLVALGAKIEVLERIPYVFKVSRNSRRDSQDHPRSHRSWTFLVAAAATVDRVLTECEPKHMDATLLKLEEAGAQIDRTDSTITLDIGRRPTSVDITTVEYPALQPICGRSSLL